MSIISLRDIPEELHREFKAACARKGTTIREELLRLMREEVEKAARKK
jgi:hypothetical protein